LYTERGFIMKTFTVIDENKPLQFFINCTGCILEPKKMDQVVIQTESGGLFPVGIQMPHALSVLLYAKVMEAARKGGIIEIPDMQEMNDDEIRESVERITIR
jgi:hypothetical protein